MNFSASYNIIIKEFCSSCCTFTHAHYSFVLKSKKKSKVLPVHSNGADLRQASQYSSIGKGHMNLEAVDDQ